MSSSLVEFSSALLGGLGLGRRLRTSSTPPAPSFERAFDRDSDQPAMTFTRSDTDSEVRIHIAGVLDVHTAPEVRAVFDAVVAEGKPLVTIDLEGLTMMDSSGVGAIVSLFKRVKASGGHVVVTGVTNQPLAVCKLLKLDRVFGL
jgi:anti-sigma B factor antagonist